MKQAETKAALKRDFNYARVEDEATFILTYPGRTGEHSGILELARPPQGERAYVCGCRGSRRIGRSHPRSCPSNATTTLPTLPLSWVA
jgi:hypothetical protein